MEKEEIYVDKDDGCGVLGECRNCEEAKGWDGRHGGGSDGRKSEDRRLRGRAGI